MLDASEWFASQCFIHSHLMRDASGLHIDSHTMIVAQIHHSHRWGLVVVASVGPLTIFVCGPGSFVNILTFLYFRITFVNGSVLQRYINHSYVLLLSYVGLNHLTN